jgi:DNA-binding Lrp family transcriptional regulator
MELTRAERRLLRLLVEHGPSDYRQLAAVLGAAGRMSHGSVAKQLEGLRRIGCVEACGEARPQPRQFAATPDGLAALAAGEGW